MTKLKEIFRIIFRKNEEVIEMKEKWSFKKKLALGGLGIIGLIGGIFTLSKYGNSESTDEEYFEDEDFDSEDDESEDLDGFEDSEVEMETQE